MDMADFLIKMEVSISDNGKMIKDKDLVSNIIKMEILNTKESGFKIK